MTGRVRPLVLSAAALLGGVALACTSGAPSPDSTATATPTIAQPPAPTEEVRPDPPDATATASATVNPASAPAPTLTAPPTPAPEASPPAAAGVIAAPAPPPSPTPAPPPSPTATATPAAVDIGIPTPPDRDMLDLAQRFRPAEYAELVEQDTKTPELAVEGDRRRFWILLDSGAVRIDAVVRRVSQNAVWWFDDRLEVATAPLDEAVAAYEDRIWPAMTGLFGSIESPGIDGDPRLNIVHTTLRDAVAGYFNSVDGFPQALRKFSNEGQYIYMSSDNLEVGEPGYVATLAHELQHAIHYAADPGEDAWVNEGLSEVATDRAGYDFRVNKWFLAKPDIQLNSWPYDSDTGSSYGAARSFFGYLDRLYGGDSALAGLIAEPADGLEGIDAYLEKAGYAIGALDVFSDWVAASYLRDDEGRYAAGPQHTVRMPVRQLAIGEKARESVEQLGADYFTVEPRRDAVRVRFEGDEAARLLPVAPLSGETCWWSNSGDSIDTTLTREFDLREVEAATLLFGAWYSIEEDWDYAYVAVSIDGGETWEPLEGLTTTTDNPNGSSYGHGFTGESEGWLEEKVDLTPYAGGVVQVRFEYITDAVTNVHGICIDDVEIPEIGFFDDAERDGGWTASGFVRTGNEIPQRWSVQVLRTREEGSSEASRLQVGLDGTGELVLTDVEPGEEIGIAVSGLSIPSILPAKYLLTVERMP